MICKCSPSLGDNCYGEAMISGMWKAQLPDPVRQAGAGMRLTSQDLDAVLEDADAVYETGQSYSKPPNHDPRNE